MEPGAECIKDDYQMDEIVKQRLKSCEVTSKGLITGYVDAREDYDNLIRDLKVFGYSFAVRSCSVGDPEKGALKFKSVSTDVQIPFFGSPFHIEGTTYFLCAQGNKYYKTRDEKDKSGPEDNSEDGEKGCPKKRRRKVRETIKMGCPARMTVKCVRVYPDYKTLIDSWRRKSDVLQRLKADLKGDPPPRNEVRYWVALSPESAHTHKRNTTLKIQSLHPDLILEIHTLVMRGVTSVRVIKAHLRNVVDRMFAGSSLKPDPSNSAFYPSDKSVYNHSHEAKILRGRMEKNEEKGKLGGREKAALPNEPSPPSQSVPSPSVTSTVVTATPEPSQTMSLIETPFTSEWQDTQMLTPNLVQVNGDGTIVYVMAQQIENVDGAADGALHDAANGLMSVKMDDNSYIVSVIPEGSSGRIVNLNDGVSTDIGNVIDQVELLDRTNDGNRVITMEGNVVSSEEQKPNHFNQLEASSITYHHQIEPISYANQVLPTSSEELSRKAMEESIEEKAKREDILELIREQELKLNHGTGESEEEVERFDKGQQTDEVEDQPEPIILNEEEQHQLQMLQQEQRQQEEQQQQQNEGTTKEQRAFLSLRAALRDCAQDVINMSYSCANHSLLEEAFSMVDTCRQRMVSEQERRQKGVVISGEVQKRHKLIKPIRAPIKTRRHTRTRNETESEARKISKPNLVRNRKPVDSKACKAPVQNHEGQQWVEQRDGGVMADNFVLYRQGVVNSVIAGQDKVKQIGGENDSDDYELVISES